MNNTNLNNNNNGGNDMPINVMSNEAVDEMLKNSKGVEDTNNTNNNDKKEKKTKVEKTSSFKPVAKIHAGVDAGNGFFKYVFQNYYVEKNGKPLTKKDKFESVLDIDNSKTTGDIDLDNTVIINGVPCKVNGGKRIGERAGTLTKQNKYTRANFYLALLKIYLDAYASGKKIINDFYISLGTTSDMYDNEIIREQYKQYMLGNIDYEEFGEPLNGKIHFKYYNKQRGEYSDATINIKRLDIEAEGVASLFDLDVKNTGFDFNKNAVILDLGTQTSHVIPYRKRTADYKHKPNRNGGYKQLIENLVFPLMNATQKDFDYSDAEVEFSRRDESEYKNVIDTVINDYIKTIVIADLERANTNLKKDQIIVTGGTSVELRSEIEQYFKNNYGVGASLEDGEKSNLMFVRDGFFANAIGLLTQLNRKIQVEEALKKC